MKTPKLTPDQKAQVLGDTPPATSPTGSTPLCWLVVNPGGKLLAILDSESEAYWFTRNRGHAHGAVYFKAPFTRAMACMRPWPCMGLSAYIVCRQGASNPVNHMSRTMTMRNGSRLSLKRFASFRRLSLLRDYAAAPDLLAVVQQLHRDVNGLNATERATSREYSQSRLCQRLTETIAAGAEAIAKANLSETPTTASAP